MVGRAQRRKSDQQSIHEREQPICCKRATAPSTHSLTLPPIPVPTRRRRAAAACHPLHEPRSRWTGRPEDKPEYPLCEGRNTLGVCRSFLYTIPRRNAVVSCYQDYRPLAQKISDKLAASNDA